MEGALMKLSDIQPSVIGGWFSSTRGISELLRGPAFGGSWARFHRGHGSVLEFAG